MPFFLETMLNQIRFMSGLLNLPALRTRVERYFRFQALHLKRYREELMRVARTLLGCALRAVTSPWLSQ